MSLKTERGDASTISDQPRPKDLAHSLSDLFARSIPYVIAAATTLVVALWTYRPWVFGDAIATPNGDSLAFHSWIMAITENGWYEFAGRLSAPFGQNSHTYTVTDEFVFGVIGKILAPLTGSVGAAVLWWVILGFPVAALLSVGVARYIGVGRAASLIPGIALPLLPDHFLRAGGHFSLSSIWAVPLGMLVVISLLVLPRLVGRRRVWFEVAMLLACVVISLTNAYFAVFTGILLATAGVGGAIAARSWRVLGTAIGRGLALMGPLAGAIFLDRIYSPALLGYSSFAVTRSPADSELYAGKITAMLLPSQRHRSAYLRDVRNGYDSVFPNPAETPALGLVAAIGFIGLVVWSIVYFWRRRPDRVDERLRALAGLNWVAVLTYVVGGLGTVWAVLLDGGGIRVWSRMHVFIAIISLLAVAVVLDKVGRRLLRVVLVGTVVAVVLVDQTSPINRPDPVAPRSLQTEMTALTAAIAERSGDRAMIYQAPQLNFPVANRLVAPATPYDGFMPYLYSDHLRWSYGGLQGDPTSDWQVPLSEKPFRSQAPLLAAAGFAGVVLDTSSLQSLPDLEGQVPAALGEPDLVSGSGRWRYYDLADVLPRCTAPALKELADLTVRPPLAYPGEGVTSDVYKWSNSQGPGAVNVITLRDSGWPEVNVSFTIESPANLRLEFPDGTTQEVPPGTTGVTWTGPVASGQTPIPITRTGGAGKYSISTFAAVAATSDAASQCLLAAEDPLGTTP